VQVPSKKRFKERVHVRFAQEVKLLRHRDTPDGNDARKRQQIRVPQDLRNPVAAQQATG